MIIGNKRVPFADLPLSHGQNTLPSTASRDVKLTKGSKVVIQSDVRPASQPKSVPFALHMALMTSQRKFIERLQLENSFLKWKLKSHRQSQPNSSSSSINKHSTANANPQPSEHAEVPKWATPKKRKIDSGEANAGIENLHSAYKTFSTPAKTPTAKVAPAKTPSAKTPITKDASTPVLDRNGKSTPSKEGIDENSPFQSKGNLLARLALLEEEIQHVKLGAGGNSMKNTAASLNSSGASRSRKVESKGSVFAQEPEEPAVSAAPAGATASTGEGSLGADRADPPSAPGSVGEDRGFHYWMLKKMYTQHTNLESNAWGQVHRAAAQQITPTTSSAKDQFLRNISLSLAPLGEQCRSPSEAPVPLSSLPMVQSKMTDWKSKYSK